MENLFYIISSTFLIGILIFLGYVLGSAFKRPKLYRFPSTAWLHVNEHPIPEDIDEFLATDGVVVSYERRPRYNSNGQPILYGNKLITAWQALPEPPKSKSSRIHLFG